MTAALVINSVLQDALSLPRPERSYLAEKLIVSLDEEAELSPAWRAEMEARVQRLQSGEIRSYSREEVSAELEAILV